MPDYYCLHCGGRHNERLLRLINKAQAEIPTIPRESIVKAIGLWQIGELSLPKD